MGSAALAYLALAFLNLDRADFAKDLLTCSKQRGKRTRRPERLNAPCPGIRKRRTSG